MNTTALPVPLICEIMDFKSMKLVDTNISAFTIDIDNMRKNAPSRAGCFGILLFKQGRVRIVIDKQCIDVGPSSLLQILPNNTIEFREMSHDTIIECVLFSNAFFADLNLEWGSREALEVLSSSFIKMLPLNEEKASSISFHISKIKMLNAQNPDSGFFIPQMLKHYFSLIIYEVFNFRQEGSHSDDDTVSVRKEDLAIKFTNLVGAHYHTHKDVQYYADQLHISRTHLTRTIKDVFLTTPKKIIEDKVISEAKNLLFKNDNTINHVMSHLNFEDHTTFTKFFKKNTGQTPSSYRKSLLD